MLNGPDRPTAKIPQTAVALAVAFRVYLALLVQPPMQPRTVF
ncbi:hypothetical protein SH528x_004938 [Novipirellula sp. SH528]